MGVSYSCPETSPILRPLRMLVNTSLDVLHHPCRSRSRYQPLRVAWGVGAPESRCHPLRELVPMRQQRREGAGEDQGGGNFFWGRRRRVATGRQDPPVVPYRK